MDIRTALLILLASVATFITTFIISSIYFIWFYTPEVVTVSTPEPPLQIVLAVGIEREDQLLSDPSPGDHHYHAELCDTILAFADTPERGYLSVLSVSDDGIATISPSEFYPLIPRYYHEIAFSASTVTIDPALFILIWTEEEPALDLYPKVLDLVAEGEVMLDNVNFPTHAGNIAVPTEPVDDGS
ncbi:MAG: hypothetical protein P8J32_05175 [bacterium]|nr:hypothetical protein [bacterium]